MRPLRAPRSTSTRARIERVWRTSDTAPSMMRVSGRETDRVSGAVIRETVRKIAAIAPPERRATTNTKELLTWSVMPFAGICSVVSASRMRTGMWASAIQGAT